MYISDIIRVARPFSVTLIIYSGSFKLNVMTATKERIAVNSYMQLT